VKLLLGSLLAGSLFTSVAAAQAEPRAVALEVPDCMGAAGSEVKHLVALELAPRMRVSETSQLTGSVQCGSSLAIVAVDDPARAEPLRVEVALAAAAPKARARLLALTLAELITTSQLEHAPAPSPAPEAPADEAAQADDDDDADADESSSSGRAPALHLWITPSVSIAGTPTTPLIGGDLGASHVLGPVAIAFDLQARFGQSDDTNAETAVRSLSASLAVMPLILNDGVQLSAGAGLRVGHIAMTASSLSAGIEGVTHSGVWLGPAALAALHVPVLGVTALRFAFEAGYFARSVVGLDERAADQLAFRGVWLSTSIGLALRMP